jgi:phytoene dehydrogenase-like protein
MTVSEVSGVAEVGPRGPDGDYDVMVVGGGLAGLAAATAAARAGARVVVLDARSIGGRARSAERDGFVLNEGPHALYRAGAGQAVLDSFGVQVSGGRPPASSGKLVWDGELVSLPGTAGGVVSSPLLSARSKARFATWFGGGLDVAARRAPDVSFAEWLDAHRVRPDLRKLVSALARVSTYAAAPGDLAAGAVLGQLAMSGRGVRYLDGGWQQIVAALAAAARVAGATVVEHVPVAGLTRTGGTWSVTAGDGAYRAGTVVLAAGGPAVAARVLGGDPAGWVERAGPVQRAACLDVGAAPGPETFLLSADGPYYLSMHSATAANLAPDGHALTTVAKYLAPDDPAESTPTRAEIEAHAALGGVAPPGARTLDRYLAACTVAWGAPVAGVARPTGDELGSDGVFTAGDWVGPGLLADAALASGARAGTLAAARAATAR